MSLAICIASGASLTKDDVDYCKGKGRVYVVKETHRLAPWADVLYAADTDWWEYHKGVPEFVGEKWTCSSESAKRWKLNHIDGSSVIPWGQPGTGRIGYGGNSGFQVLNLAVLHGASKVILLGYDMQFTKGRKHWFTGLDNKTRRDSNYADWLTRFNLAAPLIGVPVENASRNSAIECFPRIELQHAFDS